VNTKPVGQKTPMQHQTPIAQTTQAPAADTRTHRIWPVLTVALGLGLTAAWASLLGYVFISLIMRAF